ncbi:MAG: VOC family protein [Pseudomonadota bacterium]
MSAPIAYEDGLTVSMSVSNLDNAIDWYTKVLGFEFDYRMDEIGWCELKSPVEHVKMGLSVVETPNPGGATPTFGVADIEKARASLVASGVRIDGEIITIEKMVRFLSFYDPDDNALMFYQLVPQND